MSKSLSKSRFIELFGDIKEKNKWPREKWSDVCEIINGKDFKSVEDPNGQYAVYGTGGFMAKANQYTCPENSIIIGRKGTINKPLLVKEKFWNIDTAFGVVPNITKVHYQYFYWFCKQFNFMSINKGTTLPSTTKTDLQKIEINVPPLELQLHFSHLVDQIDKSKFILQKMIEKLELLKKSRFVEMFGNIKETIPLENCCSLISDFVASGSFASLRDNVKYYDKENYAVLVRTIDFANNFSKDLVYTDKHGYDFLSKTNLYGGEILLSNIGASIGKVFRVPYLNKPMTLAPNSIVIKPNDNYTNEFLEYFFSIGRGQDELHVMTTATATPKFNKTQLRQVPVPKVSKEIQNDFSCFVKQLDKSKLILQKQLEDLVGETK